MGQFTSELEDWNNPWEATDVSRDVLPCGVRYIALPVRLRDQYGEQ